MAGDDFDRAEVDRLVQDLASRRAQKQAVDSSSTLAGAVMAADEPEPRTHAPGRRWSNARLLMPSVPVAAPRKAFAFASAMHLPALPQLSLPVLTESQWLVLTARMFVGLGLVLAAVMPYWPYANGCSWGLMLYLSAVLLVVVTGVWGAKLTWDARLGGAHALALCVVFWGLTLITAEVLPRIGYAQAQQAWFCPL